MAFQKITVQKSSVGRYLRLRIGPMASCAPSAATQSGIGYSSEGCIRTPIAAD